MTTKPRVRNAANSRAIILKAATKEFAEKGFDGARVDRIASRSKVNKNLLYLYFGSKDQLFLAVLEKAYTALRARHEDELIRTLSPLEGLERFVRATYNGFLEIPEIIPLANSENLHRATHLKNSEIRKLYSAIPGTLGDLYHRGLEDGVFRSGVDIIELYISIVSLCSYHISNKHTLSILLDTDLMDKTRVAAREEHVVAFVLDFLQDRQAYADRRNRAPGDLATGT